VHGPDFGFRQFLSRVSTLTRDIDIGLAILSICLSVRPSVRPSVRDVPVSDENGITYRHGLSPDGSPIILILPASNIFTKFRWGIKISRFSTTKSLYLANDTRYRHSYYGRQIGNRTQAFKWHQFQRP